MLGTLISGTIDFLKQYPKLARAATSNSMTQYTKSTRSEPITMIDTSISNMEELPDLMMTLTSIYAAMYAQSFSIAINQEIGNIKVLQTLDQINPNRSKMEGVLALASGLSTGLESNHLMLPDYKNLGKKQESVISFEAVKVKGGTRNTWGAVTNGLDTSEVKVDEDGKPIYVDSKGNTKDKDNNPITAANGTVVRVDSNRKGPGHSTDIESITKFMTNLSTGILFEVTVEADGRKVSIPISVRLLANQMSPSIMTSLFTAAVKNRTAKERYHEWRAGGLALWNDVILCKDIARENRRNLIKDTSGMYSEVLRRKSSNQITGALSGNPSISQISNILIVSDETVALFERESGKKLKAPGVRDLIFNNTQTLILAVVNRNRETVTLYYHDISVPTTVTFRDLKGTGGKGGGPDVMEIIKAFQMGNGINL